MSQSPPVVAHAAATPRQQRTPGARISELDGLRGIAILLVLVFHYTPSSGPLFLLDHIFQIGWSGVDLFFVLSGYLITGILLDTAGRRHYYRNFIVRRTLRIFPLYYACLLLYAFLTFYPTPVRWGDYMGPGDAAWYLAYIGNLKAFVQNAWPGAAILTPLWSLQVEEQFYLSFPFIVGAVRRRTLARILFASVVVAFLLRVGLTMAMPKNLLGTYLLMPSRMDALAMGGLVAIARREWPEHLKSHWIPRGTAISALIAVVVCVIWGESPWSGAMRTLGFTAIDLVFTGVLVLLITGRPSGLLALCRKRPLVWLGTISYGLYLLHIPALTAADKWIVPALRLAPRGSAEMMVAMAIAIGAATLSWLFFESQILKWKERFTVR